jgi:hypothetical protein
MTAATFTKTVCSSCGRKVSATAEGLPYKSHTRSCTRKIGEQKLRSRVQEAAKSLKDQLDYLGASYTACVETRELRLLVDDVLVPEGETILCPLHDDQRHGREAEELRSGLENILEEFSLRLDQEPLILAVPELVKKLADLLDRVDARDSAAFLDNKKARAKARRSKKPQS